jgi:hypothetical protein
MVSVACTRRLRLGFEGFEAFLSRPKASIKPGPPHSRVSSAAADSRSIHSLGESRRLFTVSLTQPIRGSRVPTLRL